MQNSISKGPADTPKSQNNDDQSKGPKEQSTNYEYFVPEARKMIKQVFTKHPISQTQKSLIIIGKL